MSRCKACDDDQKVLCLDEDGVFSYLTGKPGAPMHAVDIYFGRCQNYRKVRGKNIYKKIPEEVTCGKRKRDILK